MKEKQSLCQTGDSEPILKFAKWFDEAKKKSNEANAMALSTVGADMQPSSRMVLLKDFDESGFVFYTNLGSQKAKEISENPKASLLFYWKELSRQVRIRGTVERVSDEEADAYYKSRDLGSQIGAWASKQSQDLDSKKTLLMRVAKAAAEHGSNPERPCFWSGFRLKADNIEFWQKGNFRLHTRYRYKYDHAQNSWSLPQRLYP